MPAASVSVQPIAEPASAMVVDPRALVRAGLVRLASSVLGREARGFAELEHAGAELDRARAELDRARAGLDRSCAEVAGSGAGDEPVLLLSIRPGDNATRLIDRARCLGLPVICVLGTEEAPLIHAALAATADGYLVLELLDRESLRDTVAAVRAGERAIPLELRRSCHDELGPVLTVRCLEILRLVSDGMHDHEIATEVGISASAVRKHIRSAQDRLTARTRTQAVAIAMRRGLL